MIAANHYTEPSTGTGNQLFPVFLKLNQLRLLIVGGGNVALEKLQAVIANAPATHITIVAIQFNGTITRLANEYENIHLIQRAFEPADLTEVDIVIAAVNDIDTSTMIRNAAHASGKLVNVADKPALCDFYLGSIVQKGNLKIAISTNGKSPTIAKRLKETLHESLPAEMDQLLSNMEQLRTYLKGDFADKVQQLNKITAPLAARKTAPGKQLNFYPFIKYALIILCSIIAGQLLSGFISFQQLWNH